MNPPSKLFKSIRSLRIGIIPTFLVVACRSKLGGKRSRGRTKVCTEQGIFSGGVESSIITINNEEMSYAFPICAKTLTVMPNPRGRANDFLLVLRVVNNCSQTETHHGEWWHLSQCAGASFWHRSDILWIIDRDLQFTPRDLTTVNYALLDAVKVLHPYS